MVFPASRLDRFPESMIREMSRRARLAGAINLAQGMPEFAPPAQLLSALADVQQGDLHQYSMSAGSPRLRAPLAEAIAERWSQPVDPERELTVTCGVTEGIVAAVMTIIENGDEVILFEPMHENYLPAVILAGGVPRIVSMEAPEFRFDPEAAAALIGPRTRAMIINTPHNPTGRVATREELQGLADLCVQHDLVMITDEIYEHLVYDHNRHIPPATLDGMRDRTIAVSGLSKILSVTGWRLGYVVAPPELTAPFQKVHDFLTICAPVPLQEAVGACLAALNDYRGEMVETYTSARNRFITALRGGGLHCAPPEGAYYVMADVSVLGADDDVAAADFLLHHGVASVPGSSFYAEKKHLGRNHLRFAFCKSNATLDAVVDRLATLSAARHSI